MRNLLLFLVLLSSTTLFGQSVPGEDFIPQQVDSIRFRVERNITKEMTLPGQEEFYELLGSFRLDSKTQAKLVKRMRKASTYDHGRALLTHHNLVFTFFSGEKVALTTHISTLTRNISLYTEGVDSFYGKISKKMGKFLIKLLVKYNLYDTVEEVGDLEGVL